MKKFMAATAMLALFLAGCSEPNRVGSKPLTDFEEKEQERLGSTSTVPEADVAAPPVTEAADKPTSTTKAPTTTAPPEVKGYPIKIQADQAGTQFEPRIAQVFAGTPITWTNTDSVARSVEFSDQSFTSGPIAPGASVTFTPKRAGEFNYSDGTRPYAVGTLKVQAR